MPTGILIVESIPDGAYVYVDDIFSERSPTMIKSIPAGIHNIRISATGYKDVTRVVNIPHGGWKVISIILERTMV